jgi:hypothetical protein
MPVSNCNGQAVAFPAALAAAAELDVGSMLVRGARLRKRGWH